MADKKFVLDISKFEKEIHDVFAGFEDKKFVLDLNKFEKEIHDVFAGFEDSIKKSSC